MSPIHAKAPVPESRGPVQRAPARAPVAKRVPGSLSARLSTFTGPVRLHPDAREVTEPLAARAVTHGQDVYFHPGQYRPDTPAGRALLRHELAHTLQTRAGGDAGERSGPVSRPGDALEENADALARGATSSVLAAPAGALLRTPFDNESDTDRARREALLRSIANAEQRIIEMLRTGGLLENFEVPVERAGVRGVVYGAANVGTPDEEFTSYTDRHARLRRVVRTLQALGTMYRTAPIPAEFAAPVEEVPGSHWTSSVTYTDPTQGVINSSYGGHSAEWADLQGAYARYRIAHGQLGPEFDSDWYYLDPSARIVPYSARGAPRVSGGIQTGAYMVVPDIDHDPLRYFRLDGFTPIPRGSVIVEFWHDDFGYYYWNRGVRIDVPSPWTR